MAKVEDINKNKKDKPMTPEEIAEWARRQAFKKCKAQDEPDDLYSGKTDKNGGFVNEDDDDK